MTLTPWTIAQVEELHAMFSEPEVGRYLCDGEAMPLDRVEEQIRASESRFAAGSLGVWSGRARRKRTEVLMPSLRRYNRRRAVEVEGCSRISGTPFAFFAATRASPSPPS